MNKNIKIITLLFFLILIVVGCSRAFNQTNSSIWGKKLKQIKIKEQIFLVEIVKDKAKIQKGLMFRKKLAKNQGMLFVFNRSGRYNFWMKNTLIPLDIIWINKDKIVVDVQKAQPCKDSHCPQYFPAQQALYVLEVNAGEFRGQIGDEVEFKWN